MTRAKPCSTFALKWPPLLALAVLLLAGHVIDAEAESERGVIASAGGQFELSWWKVASGGGHSSGGDFSVDGTVGQHDAFPNHPVSAGDLAVVGGFWVAFYEDQEALPDLLFGDRFEEQ